jgi:hypothetical protein
VKVGIKAEEEVYYGFAEGDQLIFSFEETGGKEMKKLRSWKCLLLQSF